MAETKAAARKGRSVRSKLEGGRSLQIAIHRLPPERQAAMQKWLARASRVIKLCRVEGHQWPDYIDETTTARRDVRLGANVFGQRCQRVAENEPGAGEEQCGVRRERYISLASGMLPKANKYDYSQADGYRLPGEAGGGIFASKEINGIIRLSLAEDVEAEE